MCSSDLVVKDQLPRDLFRLYQLIWKRFVASRMSAAKYETTSVKITAGKHLFTLSASKVVFDGFMAVYVQEDDKEAENKLSNTLTKESELSFVEFDAKQHFTQPPAHFTEASLVHTLEELGIGRPSTYAPTITTLLGRHYITKEQKNLYMTDLGEAVNDIMKKQFPSIVDVSFTASLESLLDSVGEGEVDWKSIVRNFYPDLDEAVNAAQQNLDKVQIADDKLVFALTSGSGPSVLVGDRAKMKSLQGIMVYDLKKDPENPEFLGYWDCGVPYSMGVHRFMYNGGDLVHLSCEADEFEGMIYRIVNIADPSNIYEVGRWWAPHQYIYGVPGREVDHSAPHCPDFMDKGWMHGPPFVIGDKAYLGYGGDGLYVLDVSDFTRPKALGQLRFMPAFSSRLAGARTHTALPLKGRDLCVVMNEGERFGFIKDGMVTQAQAMNNIHMVDVSDPTRPTLIAEFPYPEVPEDFPAPNFNVYGLAEGSKGGPFGPHNLHEPMDGKPWLEQRTDVVYDCYFAAGLRVYDVSDPFYIKEDRKSVV